MKVLLLIVLAAYVVAAIHYVLAFVNKRRAVERVAFLSLAVGLLIHTASLVMDWTQEGHYPLFDLRETFSFLAWTLVIAYLLTLSRYRTMALGSFTIPLVAVLTYEAVRVVRRPDGVSRRRHAKDVR